jgi:peroxiredoxin
VAQLCQHQEALDRLDVEVLIISFGTMPAAERWLEETCNPFRLLLDPERTVYDAYGLERSLARSWNLRTIWRYVQLLTSGRQWRGIQGDSAQLGGDFIVDADGIVQLAYRSHDPTDRPDVDELLSIMQQRRKQRKGELTET